MLDPPVDPLPYQRELADYLKNDEADVWKWFAEGKPKNELADAVRLDLLKSTYRTEREQKADLYEIADAAATELGLDFPLTLYQAQNPEALNVSIAYVPAECHIVLHGAVQDALTTEELRAVFGHELTHFLLQECWNGDFGVVGQILNALVQDAAAQPAHLETFRLFALYTELLADRGAYHITRNPLATISGLLKLETGDKDVSAEAYARQAEEIFAKEDASAEGLTHPETFIRTRALQLWAEAPDVADDKVRQLIEGPETLSKLDLLGRKRVTALTRRLIEALLAPKWFQTESVLAHARLFFDGFVPVDEQTQDQNLPQEIKTEDSQLQDYYCYTLLDFVAADRDLEEAPLAAALALAGPLGLRERFEAIAIKELKLKKKLVEKTRDDADTILKKARAGAEG